jgi:7,8-dihydroneopterin aldolase/epimerase/oxygenase
MAQLILDNMEFYSYHGHLAEEQIIGNRFIVDVTIDTDISRAADTDNLEDTIDYCMIYNLVKKEMDIPSRLLEHLARRITDSIYTASEKIMKVTVKVSKMNPAIGGSIQKFSVVFSR